ncbi:MAG: TonB-dependent receptor [Pseudomonadota bacterium]
MYSDLTIDSQKPLNCRFERLLVLCFLLLLTPSAIAEFSELGEELLLDEDQAIRSLPVVLSATRLKQPLSEAPASVTIIDRELIEASGARVITDLFRFVPGMQVGDYNGHLTSVSYHGIADENAKRMQVLVNGRSIYQPGLSRVIWTSLPLEITDIDRIEVIRGPNSAMYGANSTLAVINIITVEPADAEGLTGQWTVGDRGINDLYLGYGKSFSHWDLKLSLGLQEDTGQDVRLDDIERNDSRDLPYFYFFSSYQLNERTALEFSGGIKEGDIQTGSVDSNSLSRFNTVDMSNRYLQLSFEHSSSQASEWKGHIYYTFSERQENWESCAPSIFLSDELGALHDADRSYTFRLLEAYANNATLPNPPSQEIAALAQNVLNRLIPNGFEETCGLVNQDMREQRYDLELQNTYRLNDEVRLVSGINTRRDIGESETYFGTKEEKTINRLFFNVEYRILQSGLLNFGAAFERDSIVGSEFSPRVAFNYLLDSNQSFRFVVARASRSPDLLEEKAQWNYTVRDLDTSVNANSSEGRYYLTGIAQGNLNSEQILSREIGYYNGALFNDLEVDVKLFYDTLDDLIENDLNINVEEFSITNEGKASIQGLETQVKYRFSNQALLWLTYAYVDVFDYTKPISKLSTPQHSASIMATYHLPNAQSVSAAATYMDEYFEESFARIDFRYQKNFKLNASNRLNVESVVQYRLDELNEFNQINAFDSPWHYYLRLRLDF